MSRTTHSDLARILIAHTDALQKVPPTYCVSDASTRNSIECAAAILTEQDARIESLTVALRAARAALKSIDDQRRRELALGMVNAALGKAAA